MCGRYVLEDIEDISERFKVPPIIGFQRPTFNAAPTQRLPVIFSGGDGSRVVEPLRWGLTPAWRRPDGKAAPALFNARAETVAEKPTFRRLLRAHRCLVPATGFYEWATEGGRKVPHRFMLDDGDLFAFAGLYDPGKGDEGHAAFTLLTTRPNDVVAPYHDRMPVILRQDLEDLWLDPDVDEPALLEACYEPYPAGEMREHAASTRVNDVRNDDPDLLGEDDVDRDSPTGPAGAQRPF